MKKENTVFLKDVLELMKRRFEDGSFIPFSLKYRTFNSQTKKGGKLVEYSNVRFLPEPKKNRKHTVRNVAKEDSKKRPNHWENRTRNVELDTGEVRTVRIDFIIMFNGKYVIY